MINANALAQHAAKLASGAGLKAFGAPTVVAAVASDMGAIVTGGGKHMEISGANIAQLRAAGTAVTTECWVKIPAFEPVANEATVYEVYGMMGTGDRLYELSWSFIIYHNAYHPVLYFAVNQTAMLSNVDMRNYEGQWVHVAATWDGASNTLPKLYINGVLDVTTPYFARTGDSGFPATSSRTLFGGLAYNGQVGGNSHDMLLDECRVWFSERTAQEIMDNKDISLANPAGETDLKAYFKFNGDLADSSPLGNSSSIPNGGLVLDETQDAISLSTFDVVQLAMVKKRNIIPRGAAAVRAKLERTIGNVGGPAVQLVMISGEELFNYETRKALPIDSTRGDAKAIIEYTPDGGTLTVLKVDISPAQVNVATNREVALGTIPAGSTVKGITFLVNKDFDGRPEYTHLWVAAKE